MVDKRVRDMAAASALGGTELFYSDDGASDVKVTANQIATFTNTHAPFSTNIWIDIRDYGDISSGTITTAFQATLDAIGASTTAFKNILIPDIGANLTCGAITFPTGGYTIGLACQRLTLTATLSLPSGTKLIGLTSRFLSLSGATGQLGVDLKGTTDPIILVSQHSTTIENIAFEPSGGSAGTSVKYFKSDTSIMKNCQLGGLSGGGNPALILDEHFWFDCQDCVFNADNGTPAVLITGTAVGAVTGGGLLRFQNICMTGGNFKINAQEGASSSEGIYVDFMQHENLQNGESIIELDSTDVEISDCIFKNVLGADGTGTNYMLKNTGTGTKGIRIQAETVRLDPASDPIEGLEIITQPGVDSGEIFPFTARPNLNVGVSTPIMVDKVLLSAPRGPQWAPGTILNVSQDASTWVNESSSPTVTTGLVAPDGTLTAAGLTGSGSRRMFGPTGISFAQNDWLIYGCWVKASATDIDTSFAAGIDLNDFGGGGINFPGGGQHGLNWGEPLHDGWKWGCKGIKFTTAASGTTDVKFLAGAGFFFWNPCLQIIPASLGFKDADVEHLIRSYRGGWAPQTTLSGAGQVGILDHQSLYAGAGLKIKDGVTAPATILGHAQIYVDTVDGDLKVKFGDGTIKTIVLDT